MAIPRKKIILLGPAYPYRGGNAMFIQYLYEALNERFDVVLLNYSLLYPEFLFPGTTQYDTSSQAIKAPPSIRIINSVNPISWNKTAQYIANASADMVVFDWWNPFFGLCHRGISSLIRNRYRGKMLWIAENFVSHESRFVDMFLTRMGLYHADAFLALSAQVEQDLKILSNNRPIYRSELPMFDYSLGNSYERRAEKRRFGIPEEHTVLLFFGYVRKYKGLDILLQAIPKIIENNPKTSIVVAGEFYDSPQEYFDLAEKLGIRSHVHFVNEFIPNEEVGRYFAAADVVVQPYRSATQSGILNVAFSFGVPAIVTRVGGLEEYVEHEKTGVVVDPNSSDAVAEGVALFFTLSKTVSFSENIRQRVEASAFDAIADVFESILEDMEKVAPREKSL